MGVQSSRPLIRPWGDTRFEEERVRVLAPRLTRLAVVGKRGRGTGGESVVNGAGYPCAI